MSLAAGSLLGRRYRVVRVVGEGSMGTVYEAEHVRIGRRVAVKVLHRRYARNERAVVRFIREARAAGAVGHRNIVEATDFGEHEAQPYFVMELLRGEELAERLAREARVEPERACRMVGQVLSALASAHAAGIVHRDLKPENIYLVAETPGRDTVKLLDFGLSKFRRADGSSRFETHEGVMMGTPAYMAPEQWMGRRDIDHRADLFAVGVVLYELLTGTLPYRGETQGELFQSIVNGTHEPPPPSAVCARVPAGLDSIVLRALRRERGERFQTAQAFLEALRPFGAEGIEVVDSPPASAPIEGADETLPTGRKRARESLPSSRRVPWLAGGAIVAALLVATSLLLVRQRRAPHTPPAQTAIVSTPSTPPPSLARTVPPLPPSDVRIELRGLPQGAEVRLDGLLQDSSVLEVPRQERVRRVEVRTETVRRTIEIRPDRDQVVVVDVEATVMPPPPRERSGREAGAGGMEGTRRATRPRGIGALGVTHEF